MRKEVKVPNVPFFANPDNSHCLQAALRMVLKYFTPELEYTWKELDFLTGKKEGLWTWPLLAMARLRTRGFDVASIDGFDYKRFAKEGQTYIIEYYGREVGTAQIEHCDIDYEMKNAELFMQEVEVISRIPDFADIGRLLDRGYLIVCNVNSNTLNNIQGYTGHFVVLHHLDCFSAYIHDPGPPGYQGRKVSREKFNRSWAYSSPKYKNIMGLGGFRGHHT